MKGLFLKVEEDGTVKRYTELTYEEISEAIGEGCVIIKIAPALATTQIKIFNIDEDGEEEEVK